MPEISRGGWGVGVAFWAFATPYSEITKNNEYQKGVSLSRARNKSPRVATSRLTGDMHVLRWLRYGKDVERPFD